MNGCIGDALASFDVANGVPAATLTTWRVGGPIDTLVRVHDPAELVAVSRALSPTQPVVIIGRGSNLLVADGGFRGVGLMLGAGFETIEIDADASVQAGGAVALPVLARRTAAAGRAGLEFYVGIPGSVGAAVRMNAGGHGCDTASVLVGATLLTLGEEQVVERRVDELGLRFRGSDVGPRDVVIGATFQVANDEPAACVARVDDVVRWRREHQPGGANAGSVFVNPLPLAAAELIERCGLKGHRIGGAVVSAKHANFIQADDGASAADVRALIDDVRRRVADATGVTLRTEVQMVGFDDTAGSTAPDEERHT
jgi:UDP-N-acetylmuramate dehydrogenase